MHGQRNHPIQIDYFLFSCHEHEKTNKSLIENGSKPLSWPELMDQEVGKLSGLISEKNLAQCLLSMAVWYRDRFPVLASNDPLDEEVLNEVVPPLCAFNKDIDAIYKLKVEEDLPCYEASVGNLKVWDDIDEVVGNLYGNYHSYFMRYIQWSHASEKELEIEPGSRPPIGKFAPRQPRDRDRGGRSEGRNDRGGRGQRNDRGGRNERGGGRKKFKRNDKSSMHLEKAALTDVDNAIKNLEQDKEIEEVTLKPTNSFYRRLQHQTVMEKGYHSFSVGEGQDRAVRVARKD